MSKINGNRFSGGNSSKKRRAFFGPKRKMAGKKMRGEYIDVSKFVKKSVVGKVSEPTVIKNAFSDFKLCDKLQKNLENRKYLTPTPIQDQTIEHALKGRDLIGLANTGTGKTAAFLLPMINKCFHDRNQKVLIVAPTRELAIQIDGELKKFTFSLGIFSAICVGGSPIFRQITDIRRNPNFVIGTPGRLKDLKDRKVIDFSIFQNIILDEIDRMLDMGFAPEIKKILADMPKQRQSLFFSATLPPKIKELSQQFLTDPLTVRVYSGETAENIEQDIVRFSRNTKFDKLKDLLITRDLKKVLIFSETKRDVEKLTENLTRDGFKVDSIHGDKRQSQRQKALLKFKENHVQILVATDVAARGLDIKNVTHVINYTVPQTFNDYIHRIGRTGRGNEKGFALTFIEGN
ncbi:MAG TPA: DEAD/DEAH box helicase [Candidatus Moranbacteria bacterium]|nr:DEAD/DEAH box helicase [Candidatus Moranbacteria bacterium]